MKSTKQALREVGVPLADSLAILEARLSLLDPSAIREAIIQTWERLGDDVASGRADLSGEYLADLHRHLANRAGGDAPGLFIDRGQPLLRDGQQTSWALFVEEVSVEGLIEPAWILAQLRWGEHVRSLSLSLGWFAMNIVMITNHGVAITPPVPDHERLLQCLEYAGPELYDAESLRALIGIYAADQLPPASG